MHLKHKFWLFAFLVMFAGCASMEQAKSFNEQAAYADSTLDGIVTSLSSQYQAGVITKAEKDSMLAQVQKALDGIKTAKGMQGLKDPKDAQAALQDAQVIILQLQKQLQESQK